jgi:hypothetical protein
MDPLRTPRVYLACSCVCSPSCAAERMLWAQPHRQGLCHHGERKLLYRRCGYLVDVRTASDLGNPFLGAGLTWVLCL